MTIETLRVIISAETKELNNALDTTKRSVNETKKSVGKSSNQMGKFASSMARKFSIAQLAVQLIMKTIQAFIKLLNNGLANIYKFSSAVGGDFSKNIDSLRDSLSYYGNSIASAFIPLLNAIIPSLVTVLDTLSGINNKIAEMNAYLTNQKTYLKAVKKEGVTTLNALLQQYQKLKRALSGFDELNILNNNNDVMEMFEIEETEIGPPLDEYLTKIREVGQAVKDVFEEIWKGIKQRAEKLWEKIQPVFLKFKGILDDVETKIVRIFNPSEYGLEEKLANLFDITDWGIMSPFFGIDIALDSETLDAIINAVPTALSLWINLTQKAKEIFKQIGETVKDIVTTLTKPIDNAIADFINSIVKWYEEDGGKEWLDKVGEDIKGIIAKLDEAWQKVKPTFERIGGKITKMWEEHIKPFLGSVKDLLGPVWEIIKSFLEGDIEHSPLILILELVGDFLESIAPTLNLIFDILKDINMILKPILDIIVDIIHLDFNDMERHIEDLLLGLETLLRDIFVGLVNMFIGHINSVIFTIRDTLNYIIDGLNSISEFFGGGTLEKLNWQGIPELEKPDLLSDIAVRRAQENRPEGMVGPIAINWNASDYFNTTDSGAMSGNTTVVLEVDGQSLGRASLTNINRLSKQAGYVNLNLAY